MSKNIVKSTLIAGAVVMAAGGAATLNADNANAISSDKEKCYGIVKAGHNDCGHAAGAHSCEGQATVDSDPNEWIALPKGMCERIVGASLTPAGK